jgi:hypothetical protein
VRGYGYSNHLLRTHLKILVESTFPIASHIRSCR